MISLPSTAWSPVRLTSVRLLGCSHRYCAVHDTTQCDTTPHHIMPQHIISHHNTSYHNTSHHITSYHIISHHITSHHTNTATPDPNRINWNALHLQQAVSCDDMASRLLEFSHTAWHQKRLALNYVQPQMVPPVTKVTNPFTPLLECSWFVRDKLVRDFSKFVLRQDKFPRKRRQICPGQIRNTQLLLLLLLLCLHLLHAVLFFFFSSLLQIISVHD